MSRAGIIGSYLAALDWIGGMELRFFIGKVAWNNKARGVRLTLAAVTLGFALGFINYFSNPFDFKTKVTWYERGKGGIISPGEPIKRTNNREDLFFFLSFAVIPSLVIGFTWTLESVRRVLENEDKL